MAVREDVLQAIEAAREARRRMPLVLRKLMAHYDLNEEAVALAFGVKRQTINNRLNGRTPISAEEEQGWARLFEVPAEVLYMKPNEALLWVLTHSSSERDGRLADLLKRQFPCTARAA